MLYYYDEITVSREDYLQAVFPYAGLRSDQQAQAPAWQADLVNEVICLPGLL